MSVWFVVQVTPAAEVLAGRGAMALPDRLWTSDCGFRGPDPPLPIDAWRADAGALLHRNFGRGAAAVRAQCRR